MADYRDWCSYCGGELNFGSGHEPDCPYAARVKAAEAERRKAETTIRQQVEAWDDDKLVATCVELDLRLRALYQEEHANERKLDFLRREMFQRSHELGERYREVVRKNTI